MKKTMILAAICAVFVISATSVSAQNAQPQNKQPIPFMVVDFAALVDSHPMLQQEIKQFSQRVSGVQQQLVAERERIKKTYEDKTAAYSANSPEFNAATEQFTLQMSQSEGTAKIQIEKLKKEELEIQYRYFDQIRGLIRQFANDYNVGVVFLYRSPENAINALKEQHLKLVSAGTNPNVPKTLPDELLKNAELEVLSQGGNAIYVNPSYDMTPHIRAMIQRQNPNPPNPTPPHIGGNTSGGGRL